MIEGWEVAVKRIKYAINYGLFTNDLNHHEVADDIMYSMDKLAALNGMPEINWEEDSDA